LAFLQLRYFMLAPYTLAGIRPIVKDFLVKHWRCGAVVILFDNEIEDRWFKSRQGVWFSGVYTLQCCSLKLKSHCI
jgi:hypothetical protein